MGHDQLFKEFLHEFFRDFLELFYPDEAARLDFGTLRFLDKELFTDFPEVTLREADVVAQIHTHEGNPELILVHIEIQLRPEPDFAQRMFQYYVLLWLRYRVPILPVALYLRGSEMGLKEELHRVTLFEREQLRFRHRTVALAQLDAEEYFDKEPRAQRLIPVSRPRREQPAASSQNDCCGCAAASLKLAATEEERFSRLLMKSEYREVQEMELTWEDKVMEKGREEGHHTGLIEGKRETLLRQLTKKFGPLPEEVASYLCTLESLDELDAHLDRVLTADSLEEMGFAGR